MATTNKHVKAVIQLRRATEQEWIDVNPILREGEPALSTDKNKLKIGNGSLHWSEIPYIAGEGGGGEGHEYYAGNGLNLNNYFFSIDENVVAQQSDIPTNISELNNDSGFITDYVETDPIFTSSAAHGISANDINNWNNKSDFSGSYNDLTDKPTIPVVPTNISDFNNDVGYLIEEVDPTVPNWAKAESKPTYTAAEVGALPDDTEIPTKVSDLENDSGFITGYTETDPTVPSWAKQPEKPTYTANEVGALPSNTPIPSKTSDLTNDSGFISQETDPTVPSWAKQVSKPTYTASEVGAMPCVNLGSFDIEEYDWDYWNYLADKTDTGFYKVFEEQDGFTYFFRVERAGDSCYQEIWSTEENGLARMVRTGWYDGEVWDWDDPQYVMFSDSIYSNFYNKNEVNNLLNGKVDTSTLGNYYTDVQVDDILDNNYYTSDQVDDLLDGFAPQNMINTTWANLVSLRDNGRLTGGAYYRITDYNFVTSKLGIQSGNHQFDIVVLAISESMVSETAYAVRHAGDHYFEREVTEGGIEWLYTVYVDDYAENYGDEPVDHADDIHSGDIFCYADTDIHPDTGEEVPILYKTDANEYDFDDPDWEDVFYWCGTYDLDGDEYDMWGKYEDGVFMQQYALTPIVVEDGELIVSPVPETKTVPVNLNAWELKYCLDNDKELFGWADTNGKGVIYYMKDEFGNEAPYDFKNAMFQRRLISAVSYSYLNNLIGKYYGEQNYQYITTTGSVQYWYTFSNDDRTDGSLFGDRAYNIIETFISDGKKELNDAVVLGSRNKLLNGCKGLTMSGGWNTLTGCYDLLFTGSSCTLDGTSDSTIVNFSSVILNGGFNIRGYGCGTSTITSSYELDLGNNLTSAEIEGGCQNLTFGNYCQKIKIGVGCSNLTFGQYNNGFDIGRACSNLSFTNYFRFITVEDNCSRVTLNTFGGSTSSYVQYVKVCKGVSNITKQPARSQSYEQIYYKTGRTETAV